jgi:hypothetical protein
MSPSKEHNCDNITYMLCMSIGTLFGGCFKSMIKWSNVCPWNLKSMRQKVGVSGNWYLFMLNVLEVFDSSIGDDIERFWIWILLVWVFW